MNAVIRFCFHRQMIYHFSHSIFSSVMFRCSLSHSNQAVGWAVWVLNPGRSKIVFSKMPRLALRLTQPSVQWAWGFFPGCKVARV